MADIRFSVEATASTFGHVLKDLVSWWRLYDVPLFNQLLLLYGQRCNRLLLYTLRRLRSRGSWFYYSNKHDLRHGIIPSPECTSSKWIATFSQCSGMAFLRLYKTKFAPKSILPVTQNQRHNYGSHIIIRSANCAKAKDM